MRDAEAFLGQAIDSVLAQTHEDFELLIADDGSRDRSREIAEEAAKSDPRVRILPTRGGRGIVASLNHLLAEARGEYLARMDADDVALPERFERQVAHMAAHPECIALGSRTLLVDADGDPLRPFALELTHEEIDAAHLAGRGGAICHPAAMMRTEAVRRVGGYDPARELAEDTDLFLRLAETGRLANLPDCLLLYRIHADSVGGRRREAQWRAMAAAVRDAHARRGLSLPPGTPSPPDDVRRTAGDTLRRCAWWALRAGNVATARKNARAAFWREPWRPSSWRTLACALRGW